MFVTVYHVSNKLQSVFLPKMAKDIRDRDDLCGIFVSSSLETCLYWAELLTVTRKTKFNYFYKTEVDITKLHKRERKNLVQLQDNDLKFLTHYSELILKEEQTFELINVEQQAQQLLIEEDKEENEEEVKRMTRFGFNLIFS